MAAKRGPTQNKGGPEFDHISQFVKQSADVLSGFNLDDMPVDEMPYDLRIVGGKIDLKNGKLKNDIAGILKESTLTSENRDN